jgi:hypothetical protein
MEEKEKPICYIIRPSPYSKVVESRAQAIQVAQKMDRLPKEEIDKRADTLDRILSTHELVVVSEEYYMTNIHKSTL